MGIISCCNFVNNSVNGRDSAIVRLNSESFVYVTNSTFLNNHVLEQDHYDGSVILLESTTSATVISCVFRFNTAARRFGGGVILTINRASNATVLASEFSHNRAASYGYSIRTSSDNTVVGCSQFHNNSNTDDSFYRDLDSDVQVLYIGCSRYAIGEEGVCTSSNCEGT